MKRELFAFAVASFALFACDKQPENSGVVPPPSKDPSTTPSASATTATTTASATTTAVAVTPSSTPSATPPTTTTTASSAAVAKKDGGSAASATALKPASKHVAGKNFALDVASPGCRANEDCTMTIKLSAAGDYHVNKEYPYKFLATAAPNVTFLGKADPNTFAKANGDFVEQGEKAGLMTVRFKPASAGEAKVGGKYKMSVCSADQCQIEEEMIDLAVPVL